MIFKVAVIVLTALFLSSCSVMGVRKYDPYFKNTQELAKVKGTFSTVQVQASQPEMAMLIKKDTLSCRLTTFNMPSGQTVESYISDAMKNELDAASKISPNGTPMVITVNHLESDASGMDKGSWKVDFTYVTGHHSKNIKTTTVYESAFTAGTACRNTAEAMQDALRDNFMNYFQALAKRSN